MGCQVVACDDIMKGRCSMVGCSSSRQRLMYGGKCNCNAPFRRSRQHDSKTRNSCARRHPASIVYLHLPAHFPPSSHPLHSATCLRSGFTFHPHEEATSAAPLRYIVNSAAARATIIVKNGHLNEASPRLTSRHPSSVVILTNHGASHQPRLPSNTSLQDFLFARQWRGVGELGAPGGELGVLGVDAHL